MKGLTAFHPKERDHVVRLPFDKPACPAGRLRRTVDCLFTIGSGENQYTLGQSYRRLAYRSTIISPQVLPYTSAYKNPLGH